MAGQAIGIPIKACLLFVVVLVTAALADPPPGPKKERADKEASPGSEADVQRAAEQILSGIEIEVLTDGKWSAVKRIEKPLLFYGDPTRGNDRGSIWAWGEKGRPQAIVEAFQSTTDRTGWVLTMCNT